MSDRRAGPHVAIRRLLYHRQPGRLRRAIPVPTLLRQAALAAMLLVLLAPPRFAAPVWAQSSPREAAADSPLDPAEIVRRADRYFAPYPEFVMRLEITTYAAGHGPGRSEETGTFEVLARGSDDALVRFLRPQRDAGRLLLMTQDAFWFYVPGTRRPIRITPIQRLMGAASNGDVARLSYADTYAAKFEGEESVDGVPGYRLHLEATSPAATYQSITYWVARTDFRPLRAEVFLASGKPYKGVRYESFQPVDGRDVVTTIRILDHLRDDRMTVMRYADFRAEKLPDRLFNKNYLVSQ